MHIKEFARQLGVSTATVSRAFNSTGRISAATRARIREQARKLGYSPNRLARSMVRGRTDTLGLFYDAPREIDSDYYLSELVHGVVQAATRADKLLQMHAISAETARQPEKIAEILRTGAVDGFIVYLKTEWSHTLIKVAAENDIPFVILDNTRPASSVNLSIGDAIEEASSRVGAYIRQLGRKKPAFIHGIHDARKLAGFKAGLDFLAKNLVCDPGGVSFDHARESFNRLHDRHPEIDAIFCGNDVLAMGAIRAAVDRGLKVPDDIAVIGCDDIAMARYCNPALTTIRLPKIELGEHAVMQLLDRIEKREHPNHAPLHCELVLRESG